MVYMIIIKYTLWTYITFISLQEHHFLYCFFCYCSVWRSPHLSSSFWTYNSTCFSYRFISLTLPVTSTTYTIFCHICRSFFFFSTIAFDYHSSLISNKANLLFKFERTYIISFVKNFFIDCWFGFFPTSTWFCLSILNLL